MIQSTRVHNIKILFSAAPSNNPETGQPYKDWVFINYTFKRFEGLTQRGPLLPKHYQWTCDNNGDIDVCHDYLSATLLISLLDT